MPHARAARARAHLLAAGFLLIWPRAAGAQLLVRPWLHWETIQTAHFAVHYSPALAAWAGSVAEHIEAVDSAVTAVVGFTPAERVQILVEDPYEISNGFAFPLLRHPAIVFWATPPDPREDIGSYRVWSEMLSSHEFAHVAHLARPSRNPFTRMLWRVLPVDLGPIPLRAPRWVIEGYATYVEGRVTGSGRPHGVWRPAILRQWAIEGRLPTYGQLSAWSDYEGSAFAYLAGSAYLEWLARRAGAGDSSLVHVWRRLSARRSRSFDEAFTGVYGDAPAVLYGRFAAELTASAMAAARRLAAAGLVEGEMIQHLAWGTGDPALSPDGSRVALVLRAGTRPSRVVVWSTAPEPDTTDARVRARLQRRDPEDVPAKRFYPAPRRPLATLRARGGRSFDGPRWLRDGRRVLVWRFGRRPDGSFRPDLYLWDTQRGGVRQVTHGAGVREADPTPDGRSAAAIRCGGGHCDLVMVDLHSGAVRTLAAGDARTTFYRPRVAADGRTIAVAMQRDGRWRIVLVDAAAGAASPPPQPIDPDDGADRFDAAWVSPNVLVVVSDRTGTTNLERLELNAAHSRTVATRELTRVTGAAIAPDPDAADSSIWYLALHSRGYDVRRLTPHDSVARPDSQPLRDARLVPAVPQPPRAPERPLAGQPAGHPR
ncbi:MAG TPA: hypothetical protein VJU87_13395, partial [Gemmatimonadaceae bacterium]|nr:hypothetical protein [Gemmatimonadaceae bacterium]